MIAAAAGALKPRAAIVTGPMAAYARSQVGIVAPLPPDPIVGHAKTVQDRRNQGRNGINIYDPAIEAQFNGAGRISLMVKNRERKFLIQEEVDALVPVEIVAAPLGEVAKTFCECIYRQIQHGLRHEVRSDNPWIACRNDHALLHPCRLRIERCSWPAR